MAPWAHDTRERGRADAARAAGSDSPGQPAGRRVLDRARHGGRADPAGRGGGRSRRHRAGHRVGDRVRADPAGRRRLRADHAAVAVPGASLGGDRRCRLHPDRLAVGDLADRADQPDPDDRQPSLVWRAAVRPGQRDRHHGVRGRPGAHPRPGHRHRRPAARRADRRHRRAARRRDVISEASTGAGPEAGAGAQARWQWLSPRSLIVRPVTDLIRLLPVVIGVFFFGSTRGSYWSLGFAALAIGTSVVRFCTTRYRITDERVYLRHGLLSQKVLSVPRDRIRSVDLSAHVVYRLLGLRKVHLGTGRNDRRDGGSLHLDALTRNDDEALRAALLASRLAGQPAGAGATDDGAPDAAVAAEPAERELARLAPGWGRSAP